MGSTLLHFTPKTPEGNHEPSYNRGMILFPAIDLLDSRAVRLHRGDYDQVTDYGDPLEVARRFEAEGAEWLHVVDLEGARRGEPAHRHILEAIRRETGLKIQTGGGIRSREAILSLQGVVDRVILGTRLVQLKDQAAALFGEFGEFLVAGVDTRDGRVAVEGWKEASDLDGLEFGQALEAMGCRRVIFTDIETDGTLAGPSLARTRTMVEGLGIPVVASGGVSGPSDLVDLAALGVEGAIIGKALYEGRVSLPEALGQRA